MTQYFDKQNTIVVPHVQNELNIRGKFANFNELYNGYEPTEQLCKIRYHDLTPIGVIFQFVT